VATETDGDVAQVPVTPAPTDEELALIRRFDPDGFWT
jgi:hypothetical protein